jgi:membrane-associated protease RseP (regulator of RpoE activity)
MRTVGIIGASLLVLTALCGVSQGEESQSTESRAGAWLGVTTQRLSRAWREQKNYWGQGVMVAEVAPGSPAEEAGVAAGDVLVSVASHSLSDPRDVAQVESRLTPGQPVSVVLAKDAGRVTRIFDLEPAVPPTAADLAASAAAESATAGDSSPPAATEEPVVVPVVITSSEEETAPAQPAPNVVLRDGLKALGVQCEDLDVDLAMAAGAPEGLGVLVLAVAKDSPAQTAGIVPGDVISWAAGVTARDVAALDQALSTALSPVSMAIARSGTTRPVTIDFDLHAMTNGHARPAASFEELRRDPLVNALRDEVRRLRAQIDMLEDRLASPGPKDSH